MRPADALRLLLVLAEVAGGVEELLRDDRRAQPYVREREVSPVAARPRRPRSRSGGPTSSWTTSSPSTRPTLPSSKVTSFMRRSARWTTSFLSQQVPTGTHVAFMELRASAACPRPVSTGAKRGRGSRSTAGGDCDRPADLCHPVCRSRQIRSVRRALGTVVTIVEAQCARLRAFHRLRPGGLRGRSPIVRVAGTVTSRWRTGIAGSRVRIRNGRRPASGSSPHQTSPRFTRARQRSTLAPTSPPRDPLPAGCGCTPRARRIDRRLSSAARSRSIAAIRSERERTVFAARSSRRARLVIQLNEGLSPGHDHILAYAQFGQSQTAWLRGACASAIRRLGQGAARRIGLVPIDHVKLPVSDLDASRAFYTAALAPFGYELVYDEEPSLGFGLGGDVEDEEPVALTRTESPNAARMSPSPHRAASRWTRSTPLQWQREVGTTAHRGRPYGRSTTPRS